MDENRVSGTARTAGERLQEGLGRAAGDTKAQAEGVANRASGTTQDLYGRARDNASEAAEAAADTASSFEKQLRNIIETQPYTAVIVALGVGWLLGRTHHPL